jgi:thiol-disulfide isomerase/thioredoxin
MSFLKRFLTTSPETMKTTSKVQQLIDENKVGMYKTPTTPTTPNLDVVVAVLGRLNHFANKQPVVFSKSWCGYCRMTKSTLDRIGADYIAYDLDRMRK